MPALTFAPAARGPSHKTCRRRHPAPAAPRSPWDGSGRRDGKRDPPGALGRRRHRPAWAANYRPGRHAARRHPSTLRYSPAPKAPHHEVRFGVDEQPRVSVPEAPPAEARDGLASDARAGRRRAVALRVGPRVPHHAREPLAEPAGAESEPAIRTRGGRAARPLVGLPGRPAVLSGLVPLRASSFAARGLLLRRAVHSFAARPTSSLRGPLPRSAVHFLAARPTPSPRRRRCS